MGHFLLRLAVCHGEMAPKPDDMGSIVLLIALAMVAGGSLIIYYDEKGYDLRLRWYDIAVELGCGSLMVVAFCWDWKNIIQIPGDIERTGIPNPFAWWLYLPAYLCSIAYFAVMVRRIIITGRPKG